MFVQVLRVTGEEPVTVADAAVAARVDADDAQLLAALPGLIAAAREAAEHITGRRYRPTVIRVELGDWPEAADVLPVNRPTACALSYWVGGAWSQLDDAAYVYAANGAGTAIAPADGHAWPDLATRPVGGRVRVDITTGPAAPADVPEQVRLFIRATVSAWVDAPEAASPNRSTINPLYERLLDAERLWRT